MGKKLSEETKLKMSLAHKGHYVSEETKIKISQSHLGIKRSDETKQKISIAHKGKKLSDEHKRKLSENSAKNFLGKHHSEEVKEKISNSLKGRKISPEQAEKLAIARLGNKSRIGQHWHWSEETKRKMSEHHSHYWLGKKQSIETKNKRFRDRIGARISIPQQALYSKIKSSDINGNVYMEYLVNTSEGPKFLDVAIPELKLAFEYDAPYWHKDKEKDLKRDKLLTDLGWNITHYKNILDFI